MIFQERRNSAILAPAPVSVTGIRGGFVCGERAAGDILTMRLPAFYGKIRKQKAGSVVERRRKATLPAVLGTPEHCGLIRRDLVVCPPFWLLPRIETGDSFLWACCAPLLRLHPQGNVPAWAFAGRAFRRLWGMSVPFSLSAPLLCQIIVAILCGNFEQFANKRPAWV